LVIEKIVHPEIRNWFATAEDIRDGSKYVVKLKRAWL
jgi:hypothetical protein